MFKKILKMLGWIIVTFIVLEGFVLIAQKIMYAFGVPLTEDQITAYSGTFGSVIGALFLAFVSYKKGWCKDLTDRKVSFGPRAVLMSLAAVAGISVLIGSAVGISLNRILPMASETSNVTTLVDLFASVLVAPVIEELMFRYGIFGLLRHTFNSKVAMVVSALLFTLMHGFQVQAFIQCMFVGLVLAYVFEKTGNIWYSISVHAALNAFSAVSNALVAGGIPFYSEINGYLVFHVGVVAAAVLTIVVSLLVLSKVKTEN